MMTEVLRPMVLWLMALLLLLLMLVTVVLNYVQLQQVRQVQAEIEYAEKEIDYLNNRHRNLLVQVDFETGNARLSKLQQRYLPHLQPIREFVAMKDVPFVAASLTSTLADQNFDQTVEIQ